jgi:hypothetical protein
MSVDPSGFYANLRDTTALQAIKQYGFSCAVWVKNAEVFDPVTGTITSPAVYGVNPTFAIYGGGKSGKYPGVVVANDAGKTLGRITKKTVYMEASVLGIVPGPQDLFFDEFGTLLEILTVEGYNPGGLVLMWILTVKM